MAPASTSLASPYSSLAAVYDDALGLPMFHRTRRLFEKLARDFAITFRDALDLGCGTGLFCRYLATRWGIPVIGIDNSLHMLAIASRRCGGLPVRFSLQDMSRLCVRRPVDLITSNFDAINHLTGWPAVQSTIQRVARSLTPGGHFMFDVLTPCQRLRANRPYVYSRESVSGSLAQGILWDPQNRSLHISVVHERSASSNRFLEQHRERVYSPSQIVRCLEASGLGILSVLDAETEKRIGCRECSPRLLFFTRRRI